MISYQQLLKLSGLSKHSHCALRVCVGDTDVAYEMTMNGLESFSPPRPAAQEVELSVSDVDSILSRITNLSRWEGTKTTMLGIAQQVSESNTYTSEITHMTCTGFVCYALDLPFDVLLPDDLEILSAWKIGDGLKTTSAPTVAEVVVTHSMCERVLKIRHEDTATSVAMAVISVVAKAYLSLWSRWYGLRLVHLLRNLLPTPNSPSEN